MIGRMGNAIVTWVGARCRARRLLAGGPQRERLVEKIAKSAGDVAGHRLPPAFWKRQGEAVYRLFKLDPTQVPSAARVLCRQLLMLETNLSALARQLGPSPAAAPALGRQARLEPFGGGAKTGRMR